MLDIGFGTGAVGEIESGFLELHGIDINLDFLEFAKNCKGIRTILTNGDAYQLPYMNQSFDLVSCHFLLLWISHPEEVFKEMVRVCKPGGKVIFFAEPDYGGRIDYPEELQDIGRLQIASLIEQGADPFVGRKLLSFATSVGLVNIKIGILGFETDADMEWVSMKSEWEMIEHDLAPTILPEVLSLFREAEEAARKAGSRILFVPTFYLAGEVR